MTQSTPLTLGELEDGDYFIGFPKDGDDAGHGGFRAGAFLMRRTAKRGDQCIYWRTTDLMECSGPLTMQVLKVLVVR